MDKEKETHQIIIFFQGSGRENPYPSRCITVEDPVAEAHHDVIGGSGNGNIVKGEGGIHAIAYVA